jgi:hypothetical protein
MNAIRVLSACLLLSALPVFVSCSADEATKEETRVRRGGDPSELFRRLDTNSDGVLTREELRALPTRNRTPDEIFTRLDSDEDGVISHTEFMEARQGWQDGARGRDSR